MLEHSELVCVKKVIGKGRGVFARQPIKKGTVIEKAPILIVPLEHIVAGVDNPYLSRFFFIRDKKTVSVALGYGSLYNHSYRSNADYEHVGVAELWFTAIKDIQRGEEICINYNGDPKDRSPMKFNVVERPVLANGKR